MKHSLKILDFLDDAQFTVWAKEKHEQFFIKYIWWIALNNDGETVGLSLLRKRSWLVAFSEADADF